jgi:branched-subunit amino acid permease
MKTMTIIYLILGAAFATDFISSFFYEEEVYKVLFWETNVWVYRVYKLAFVLVVVMYFIEQRKAQKLRSK